MTAAFRIAVFAMLLGLAACGASTAAEPSLPLQAGIIGLDAHARAWTKILNDPNAPGELADLVVVAGYPGGSPDIPQSIEHLEKNVPLVRECGVEIVDSIEALLAKVDVVLVLSIDGRAHLEQARPVIAAGKPLFIDKPLAGSLADAIEIFRLSEEHGVPCFSSSSLRFAPGTQAALRDAKLGDVRGATAFSPCALEPHHPDFFWYGIHGVETLFTIMGAGCRSVTRVQTEGAEIATGVWEDGRIGTFRGTRQGPHAYGATIFGSKAIVEAGKFEGYEPLLVEIVKFFKTGKPPVSTAETLEILAFMEAADESKRGGGCPVTIESVMNKAEEAAGAVAALFVSSSSILRAVEPAERAIHRSDVVFMYDNPAMYEPYGCTVLGWAGHAAKDRVEEAHRQGVRRFSGSVGFLTEFRRVIDFSDDFLDAACRNFAGEPFIVPWLWDHHHQHKGHGAYWWCTNSPLYRQYLDARLEEVIASGVDGLHIDDYRGASGSATWLGGCFCRHCMAAFGQYLAENVPQRKLDELGIGDLAGFDYRQFLLSRGVKPEEYQKKRSGLPLAAEFYDFQVKAANGFVVEYYGRAKRLAAKPLSLCVNSGLNSPHSLMIAPHLSYFCCEVTHNAASLAVPEHPVYVYKLADGLDRPVTSTASGQDWAHVMEHNLSGLVRTWVALSYAYGHNLMAPHRQWCYTQEKGTHWYTGPAEEYAWLYRFVRQNARLLDGYEAVAPVAVVYDNAARRKGRGNIEPISTALAERNVPFTVVVAGDDWLDYRLEAKRLGRFKAVIVPKQLDMDEPQRELIEQVRSDGRLIVWPDQKRLERLVPTPVVVEGSEQVGVVPRAISGDETSPVVVHLLNRRYDGEKDSMIPQQQFTLRLRCDLLGGRRFTRATLHAPKTEPVALELTSDGKYTTVKVPELKLWGIVELGD